MYRTRMEITQEQQTNAEVSITGSSEGIWTFRLPLDGAQAPQGPLLC